MTEEWWTTLSNWPVLSLTELLSPKEKQSMDLPECFTGVAGFPSKIRKQSAWGSLRQWQGKRSYCIAEVWFVC